MESLRKRMFSETVSSSRSMDEDDVVVIDPPVSLTRKPRKGKEAVVHDVIEIDDDEDSDTAMFMNKKRFRRSYEKKAIKYSSNDYLDHQAKGAVANNFVSSGKSSSSASHKVAYGDLYLDEVIDVDEYAQLQSHFDNVDFPPGVEAPMPPIPWFDPPKSTKSAVSESSSFDTKYQAANSFASASHNVIDIYGPSSGASYSSGDYAGLYLDEFIDIDEYAQMTAYLDEVDVTPGIEAHFPVGLSLSDFSTRSVKPVSGSSSSLKSQNDDVSHPLGVSSSWILPQVSSSKMMSHMGFSYLQQQGSASSLSLGAESSNFQTQTQNDVSVKQVSSMSSDKTVGKVDGFKQFDTVVDHSDHHYSKTSLSTKQKNWAKKIQGEWKILEKDLPDMISVRVYETRMDLLRAVIVGAEGTPYHDGLFFFDVSFPSGYPKGPPHVYYHAHGLRLNPNLYACGKVCLSLLNTWSGGKEEKWIPSKSTMLQVLVSIQGLILNSEPYFNEPGWAPMKGTPSGVTQSKNYNENTFILSLRTMVYMMKTPPKHFEEFVIGHFCNRTHDILGACKAYMDGAQVGSLVKGKIQGVKGSCSDQFKNSLAGFLPTLVYQFTQIGVKIFLPPTTVGNMHNVSNHQAARSTDSWAMKQFEF
uniref:probable ubiquitin-conjugating enzyme E2 26 isoform X1 n=1 Tax=Fragaria vesca subsp. vesca TaxID=101020 RepID=UPI0005C9E93A|nr:PREDICTED: probable ubiquitin-conjugating enzyme E2 26 isoform X1 [Fragaria vesca subsp. vesca]